MSLGRDGKLKAHIWEKIFLLDFTAICWISVSSLNQSLLFRISHKIRENVVSIQRCQTLIYALHVWGSWNASVTFNWGEHLGSPKDETLWLLRSPKCQGAHFWKMSHALSHTHLMLLCNSRLLDSNVIHGDDNDLDVIGQDDDNSWHSSLSFLWTEERPSEVSSCRGSEHNLTYPKEDSLQKKMSGSRENLTYPKENSLSHSKEVTLSQTMQIIILKKPTKNTAHTFGHYLFCTFVAIS